MLTHLWRRSEHGQTVTGFFILPGRLDVPFRYTVQRIRDGGSYSTRSVTATQSASSSSPTEAPAPICYTALVSFKRAEASPLSHQAPVDLATTYAAALADKPSPTDHPLAPSGDSPLLRALPRTPFPGLDIRKVDMAAYNAARPPVDYRQLQYYRVLGALPPPDVDPNLHACAHLYASDRNSMFLVANALGVGDEFGQMASLSHTVVLHVGAEGLAALGQDGTARWFCQEARTERTGDGRGLHGSRIWDEGGVHVASTMQDGMLRAWRGYDEGTMRRLVGEAAKL